MAVPKRRQSNSRRDKRRSTKKIKSSQHSTCPQCGSVKLPHRICGECGYYGKKEIIKSELEK
jgi:large subunit ribosomal protein L32